MIGGDFLDDSRAHFDVLAERVFEKLQGNESATLNLIAEDTLFVRFNGNKVRQNTDVAQISIALKLQCEGRSSEIKRTLSGDLDADTFAMLNLLSQCRAELSVLPPDQFQVPVKNHGNSEEIFRAKILPSHLVIDSVLAPASKYDMVGFYAGGSIVRGNRNSKGQRHWFATQNFCMDYSLYSGLNAVKGAYAGSHWEEQDWASNLLQSQKLLTLMAKPMISIKPGRYRTYLAPRAVADLAGLMGWKALSASAWKQGRNPFKLLIEKKASFSKQLNLTENFNLGLAPRFNSVGEMSQQVLPIITAGEISTLLVNSHTGKEFGLSANGANELESPRTLTIASGALAEEDILNQLGTGLYLSNLHYLNWSDTDSARATGMTRYACFWVENGEIIGPIKNMRWDESFYNLLGLNLVALTAHTHIYPIVDTYSQRELGGVCTPGALIDNFNCTS